MMTGETGIRDIKGIRGILPKGYVRPEGHTDEDEDKARRVVSLNSKNTELLLELNHKTYGWIRYTLNSCDTCTYTDNTKLFELIKEIPIEPYVPPTKKEVKEELIDQIRGTRDQELVDTVDPVMSNSVRWEELPKEKKDEWKQYRRDLLDITKVDARIPQEDFPHKVVWPDKPT